MRIVHLADIHIRLLKRHSQYRKVFQNLYDRLEELSLDAIVVAGDIFQSKITISNEAIDMATNLFLKLNEISPTYIIAGNHDVSRNNSRLDSISPIVNALNLSNIRYLKDSQEVGIGNNFVLNCLSIIDKDSWRLPSNLNKVNVALYHGPIVGSVTDSGWVVDRGDVNLEYLQNFDYGFLGDIHRSNQILDKVGKFRYCGSLLAQNFSEDNNKGFLLWDIQDKSNFTCEFIPIDNPNHFITIDLEDGNLPSNLSIKENSYIRLVSKDNVSYDQTNKLLDIVKIKYNSESVIFVNKSHENKKNILEDDGDDLEQENYHDIVIQEKLIKEYLNDFNVSQEVMDTIFELNRKYNVALEQDEETILRNVNWRIKSFEWDNLFNYGEDNKVDFAKLDGIVGLFGKSYSGKSALTDCILYTIFNSITKNSRKNYNIINQTRSKGRGKVEIEIGDSEYVIERVSEKYDKRLYGKESEEAKTIVNFFRKDKNSAIEDLNGVERSDTDKNIRKIFGTIEDFLLTSMSSQFGSLAFINEGSTKRKEIIGKFLDLDLFDKKYKLLKEDMANIKGAIKKSNNVSDFEKQIAIAKKEIVENSNFLKEQEEKCNTYKAKKEEIESKTLELDKKIDSLPTKMIDIANVEKQLKRINKEIENKEKECASLKEELEAKKKLLEKFEKFEKETFDIEAYKEKRKEIEGKRKKIDDLTRQFSSNKKEKGMYEKKTQLLKEVPCGDEYKNCKFIADAFQALEKIKELEKSIQDIDNSIMSAQKSIEGLNPTAIEDYIEKYQRVVEKKNSLLIEIPNDETKIVKIENETLKLEQQKNDFEVQKKIYEDNRDVIENLEKMLEEKRNKENEVKSTIKELEQCEKKTLELHKKSGSLEQQLETIRNNRDELIKLRKEYEAYDLLAKCFHTDGIPFGIIKKKLFYINSEIAKVLASVVDFSIFFENVEDRLNLSIKHPKYDARPLDMASGAEKILASLAIRLALTNISNLPKCDLLVLDEPAVAFDSKILDSFTNFLEVLKQHYRLVIVITHLDSLKDMVESEISLSKKDGYAYINQ